MRDGVGVGHRDARLNQAEAGSSFFIEHRDFAVQNGLLGGHLVAERRRARGTGVRIAGVRCGKWRRTSSWSRKAMARTPSHLISKSQSPVLGGCSARVAFMGSMAAGMGALRAPLRPARWKTPGLAGNGPLGGVAGWGTGWSGWGAEAAPRAGRLSQTRSEAPAVWRLAWRAGRLRAISSWVRPERTRERGPRCPSRGRRTRRAS